MIKEMCVAKKHSTEPEPALLYWPMAKECGIYTGESAGYAPQGLLDPI